MSTCAGLVAAHPEQWRAAVSHPFLDGVRDGSLPERAFRAWLVQDHLFVADLLAFQARLLAAAPRGAQAVLAGGLVALEAELGWMEAHAAGLGLELDVAPHPTTAAYRAHREAVLRDGYAAAVTALWALERAYLEAWRGAAPGAAGYRELVEHWTVPEFDTYVEGLAAAADAAGPSEAAFVATARLERDFWEMAWRG